MKIFFDELLVLFDELLVLTSLHLLIRRGVTIHMKHETRHLAVHGLRDNAYRKTTNEIPNIIAQVMTWFHKHADKSFKLMPLLFQKCSNFC